jgi:hypothetical protein
MKGSQTNLLADREEAKPFKVNMDLSSLEIARSKDEPSPTINPFSSHVVILNC